MQTPDFLILYIEVYGILIKLSTPFFILSFCDVQNNAHSNSFYDLSW